MDKIFKWEVALGTPSIVNIPNECIHLFTPRWEVNNEVSTELTI